MGHARLTSGRPGPARLAAAGALIALVAWLAAGAGLAAAPPQRICSLSLAGDELLVLLVPPERLVCVSTFADDPELSNVAGRVPKTVPRLVGRIEPVLARQPDLVVVAPWNDASFVDLLGRSGVPTYVLPEADTFAEIRAALLDLGRRVGAESRAAEAASALDGRLAALDARLAGLGHRPRVLSFSRLIVAGAGTTADALIARAGGVNAAAEIGLRGHKQVPLERIIALDPDWLLLGFDPGEDADTLLDAYPLLRATRAAREGRVVVLSPRLLTAVSPFLVEGAESLARTLHPGRFDRGGGAAPRPAAPAPPRGGGAAPRPGEAELRPHEGSAR